MNFNCIIMCFIILMVPGTAYMDDNTENFGLEKLIKQSNVIVIVEKVGSGYITESVPIESEKKCPPFISATYKFKVLELLYYDEHLSGAKGTLTKVLGKGQGIDVKPAYYYEDLKLHKRLCLEGINKSPVYEKYNGKFDFNSSNRAIVFLMASPQGYVFTVFNSYEDVSKKDAVLKIIKDVKAKV
jgi:hypothetical protein